MQPGQDGHREASGPWPGQGRPGAAGSLRPSGHRLRNSERRRCLLGSQGPQTQTFRYKFCFLVLKVVYCAKVCKVICND